MVEKYHWYEITITREAHKRRMVSKMCQMWKVSRDNPHKGGVRSRSGWEEMYACAKDELHAYLLAEKYIRAGREAAKIIRKGGTWFPAKEQK